MSDMQVSGGMLPVNPHPRKRLERGAAWQTRESSAAALVGVLFAAGCGNSKSFTQPQPLVSNGVSLSLNETSLTDVDVLAFEVTGPGKALTPGNRQLLGATGMQDFLEPNKIVYSCPRRGSSKSEFASRFELRLHALTESAIHRTIRL